MAIENYDQVTIAPAKLRPFSKFIMSIGELPTSYLDSLSYAEQITWFCDYLQNKVIPAINNNAQALKEVQDLITELRNYIDTTLPEEIDNKLDEMAEDGTLANLLNNYANLIKVYDTHTELISDTTLSAGQKVKTLGYYEVNDGGGAEYHITDTVSTTEIQEVITTDVYANLIIKDEINLNALGLSSNLEDNSSIINNAIEFALNNNIPVLKIYKKDIYDIEDPIVLKDGITLDGNEATIRKVNIDSYSNVNTCLYLVKKDNSIHNYCENITIKNIILNGYELATYGIYIYYGGTRILVNNVNVSNCGTGVKTNNIWVCTFSKMLIYNTTSTAFDCGTNGTTLNINEIYVYGARDGYKFTGIVYSDISNLACDEASNIAYYFDDSTLNISSLGSESQAKTQIGAKNSFININNALLYANLTDATAKIFGLHGSKLVVRASSIGNNSNTDIPGQFVAYGTNGHITFDNCHTTKNKFLTANSGSGECTLTSINDHNGGTFTQSKFSLAPINTTDYYVNATDYSVNGVQVKSGNIWFNSYNSPMVGLNNKNNEYSKRLKVGDIIVNQGNNKTGIAMFQQRWLEHQYNIVEPVSSIDNNVLNFDSITYSTEATQCGLTFRLNQSVTNNNGAVGTITDITSNTITLNVTQGTFNAGDTIYSRIPSYMRDVEFKAIQQVVAGPTTSRPATTNWSVGLMYFDTTLGKPIWYKGSNKWVDATGTQV